MDKDGTDKSPAKNFETSPKKDAFGNFKRGYLQSNHRKVTECGLSGAAKRRVASFVSAVDKRDHEILHSLLQYKHANSENPAGRKK